MYEKKHILVVDDDIRIRKLIQKYLRKNDYFNRLQVAHEAIKFANIIDFDLLIIDVMMPGEDGLSLTKKLLESYYTPIIILTARKETSDRIIGLETGADDYISKPFEPRELILRMKAYLKELKI